MSQNFVLIGLLVLMSPQISAVTICSRLPNASFSTPSGTPCICTEACSSCAWQGNPVTAGHGALQPLPNSCQSCLSGAALYTGQCYASCDSTAGYTELSASAGRVCWAPASLPPRFAGKLHGHVSKFCPALYLMYIWSYYRARVLGCCLVAFARLCLASWRCDASVPVHACMHACIPC